MKLTGKKKLKILVSAFYKIAISRKTELFGTFLKHDSSGLSIKIFKKDPFKNEVPKIVKCTLLQAYKLVVFLQKHCGKNGPAYLSQQNINI